MTLLRNVSIVLAAAVTMMLLADAPPPQLAHGGLANGCTESAQLTAPDFYCKSDGGGCTAEEQTVSMTFSLSGDTIIVKAGGELTIEFKIPKGCDATKIPNQQSSGCTVAEGTKFITNPGNVTAMRIKNCTEKNTFKTCTAGDEEMKDIGELLDLAANAEPKRRLLGFFPGKTLANYLLGIRECNPGATAASVTCPGVNNNGYNSYSFAVDAACVTN